MSEFDPSSVAFFILLVSPLILNAIDKIYYKIRPFKTPLSAINRNDKNRMDAFDRPKEKMSKVYHGGCLSCKTPINKGVGECRKCEYFVCNWNLPSMKTE
tara:strand:- start:5554 stop:5853 length:300 start_codon:yes stop_codon:yes gene_type:complete